MRLDLSFGLPETARFGTWYTKAGFGRTRPGLVMGSNFRSPECLDLTALKACQDIPGELGRLKAYRIAARIPEFQTAQETARLVYSFGMYHNIVMVSYGKNNSRAKSRTANKLKLFVAPRLTYRHTLDSCYLKGSGNC